MKPGKRLLQNPKKSMVYLVDQKWFAQIKDLTEYIVRMSLYRRIGSLNKTAVPQRPYRLEVK